MSEVDAHDSGPEVFSVPTQTTTVVASFDIKALGHGPSA
jgi:hypothetical protein